MPRTEPSELGLAATWFLAARAMAVASGEPPRTDDASAGLYAQAILGLSEAAILEAKATERLGVMTLVDCLAGVRRLPPVLGEKILVGVMMIAYGDRRLHPLEVRWVSMLTAAAGLTADDLQRCCGSARVIAAMLRPRERDGGDS